MSLMSFKDYAKNSRVVEVKKEYDKDATLEDKANSIIKRCKKFRTDSEIGYLLSDADIIQGITDATKWSFKDAERYFKDNYKLIKESETPRIDEATWDDAKNAVYDVADIFKRRSKITSDNSINIEVRGIVGKLVFDPSFKL